jgi:G:T-mismatch repair DNA endonuclease (very short patch repair protein)
VDDDDPQDRIDLFAKYGYQTLVIWEYELKNKVGLQERLLNFLRED